MSSLYAIEISFKMRHLAASMFLRGQKQCAVIARTGYLDKTSA
ncbi:hypothetical protein A3768_4245 (plasmid) [Ralstonia solanacearum]|nr:hypothetical protein A3768_4245 [Ralstonia solanacearum]